MGETTGSIRTDLVGGVLTVTLSHPERLNACTAAMARDLIAAVDRADDDDDVGAVVFTGAGSAFCSGADLSGGGTEVFAATRDIGGELTLRLFAARKPLIAAVNGLAVGAGMTMILPMDVRLAAEGARFGLPFARRLFELVPPPDRRDQPGGGMVLHRSPLRPRRGARQRPRAGGGTGHPMEAHRVESALIPWLAEHGDAPEAMAAFLEKRPAQFHTRVSKDLPPSYPWWEEPPFSA